MNKLVNLDTTVITSVDQCLTTNNVHNFTVLINKQGNLPSKTTPIFSFNNVLIQILIWEQVIIIIIKIRYTRASIDILEA